MTGFLIDGQAPPTDEKMKAAYALFSPDGIVLHHDPSQGMTDGMPWIGMKLDLPGDPEKAAGKILRDTVSDGGPQFLIYRTILWSPTQLKTLYERVKADSKKGDRIEIVDPYSFFLLQKGP